MVTILCSFKDLSITVPFPLNAWCMSVLMSCIGGLLLCGVGHILHQYLKETQI